MSNPPLPTKSPRALLAETIHTLLKRGCTVTVKTATGAPHTFHPNRSQAAHRPAQEQSQ